MVNQKIQKPISEFTDKQLKSYKLVMKKTAKKPLTRAQLYKTIKRAQIYENKRDVRETAKMLVKNPETPLEISNSKVVNELAVNK
jgi:hypothetical protein